MSSKQQEVDDANLISGATKANLFSLKKQHLKSYLSHLIVSKSESKDLKIKSLFSELKYSVNLILSVKNTMDFIQEFFQVKSVSEIEKDLRLRLHQYFDCEFTVMMKIKKGGGDEDITKSVIKATTSKSQKAKLLYGQLGTDIQKTIREKQPFLEGLNA